MSSKQHEIGVAIVEELKLNWPNCRYTTETHADLYAEVVKHLPTAAVVEAIQQIKRSTQQTAITPGMFAKLANGCRATEDPQAWRNKGAAKGLSYTKPLRKDEKAIDRAWNVAIRRFNRGFMFGLRGLQTEDALQPGELDGSKMSLEEIDTMVMQIRDTKPKDSHDYRPLYGALRRLFEECYGEPLPPQPGRRIHAYCGDYGRPGCHVCESSSQENAA